MEKKLILQIDKMNLFERDFTLENYKTLMGLAKDKYTFISYEQALSNPAGNSVIWRHDVDFSPKRALALARIESDLACSTTYFVQLSSMFYNIFDSETKNIFNKIKDLGHVIGLHFDPTVYDIKNVSDLEKYLLFEKKILGTVLDIPVNTFSFHMPTEALLENNDDSYGGMINSYAASISMKFKYCSDSNGYWRHDRLEDILSSEKNDFLHVLTHPVWWTKGIHRPFERLKQCFANTALANENWYLNTINKFNRKS